MRERKDAVYVTVKSKIILVETKPFKEKFVDQLKSKCPGRKWDPSERRWEVPKHHQHTVIQLVKEHYLDTKSYLIEGAVVTDIHTGEVI
jgi:hypothetical protein